MSEFIKITEENQELYHFGVKGMRWGKRTGGTLQKSDMRKKFDSAKAKKKEAASEFDDAFDTFMNKSSLGKNGDRRYNNMMKTMDKSTKADKEFKQIKAERKNAIKAKASELEKEKSFKERMLYISGTRKQAAKYIVDNNMSIGDARKRANEDAVRNTALFLAAYGAIAVGAAAYNKYK